jgi:hypothetical protein
MRRAGRRGAWQLSRQRMVEAKLPLDEVGTLVGLSLRPMMGTNATGREPPNRRSRVKMPPLSALTFHWCRGSGPSWSRHPSNADARECAPLGVGEAGSWVSEELEGDYAAILGAECRPCGRSRAFSRACAHACPQGFGRLSAFGIIFCTSVITTLLVSWLVAH